MNNIASHVITKFGGADRVAELLGKERTTIYRWTYDRDRGGTGGLIPARYQHELLEKAVELGIELSSADFFQTPSGSNGHGGGG